MKICPVILSGGSGSRLWPLSRASYPKQFLKNLQEKSLFSQTLKRLNSAPFDIFPPIVVCNEEHKFFVTQELDNLSMDCTKIILEPDGKNTAPAACLAASYIREHISEEVLMLVMPSDHFIESSEGFFRSIARIEKKAQEGALCTFGIRPNSANTGYGYLKVSPAQSKEEVLGVESFHEKPKKEEAKTFLSSGEYLWNSGIFLFSTSIFLQIIDKTSPVIYNSCTDAINNGKEDGVYFIPEKNSFKRSLTNSIDYAVMEPSRDFGISLYTTTLESNWNDMGSWSSLLEESKRDINGNSVSGDIVTMETANSYLYSEDSLLASIGLKDMVVINTKDALLIAPLSEVEKVKELVVELESRNREEVLNHKEVYRPWGSFCVIEEGKNFKVKTLHVNPGGSLSLQKHMHRSEHWVVTSGSATVIKGAEKLVLKEHESIHIEKEEIHSIRNETNEVVSILEVQTGSFLGESDIVRFKDDYGRV